LGLGRISCNKAAQPINITGGKLETMQHALENDASDIDGLRSLVTRDAAEAQVAFRSCTDHHPPPVDWYCRGSFSVSMARKATWASAASRVAKTHLLFLTVLRVTHLLTSMGSPSTWSITSHKVANLAVERSFDTVKMVFDFFEVAGISCKNAFQIYALESQKHTCSS
jgi:hypothetical protein